MTENKEQAHPNRLIGRLEHQEALRGVLTGLPVNGARLVCITGPPGVGKAVLANWFSRHVEASGGLAASVRAGSPEPLGAVRQLFSDLLTSALARDSRDVDALRQRVQASLLDLSGVLIAALPVLKAIFQVPTPPEGSSLSANLAAPREALVRLMMVVAETCGPVCLHLANAGEAHEDDLLILERLLEAGRQLPIALVLSWSGSPPNRPDRERAEVVTLVPWRVDEVADAIRSLLRPSPSNTDELAEVLWARTAGLPLEVSRTVEELKGQGLLTLDPSHGRWCVELERLAHRPASSLAAQATMSTVQQLGDEQRQVLCAAACLGESFTVADLVQIAPSEAVAGTLERAAALTLIDSRDQITWRWLHPSLRRAARESLDGDCVQLLHAAIVRLLLPGLPARSFDLVEHLNLAAPLLSKSERVAVTELDLRGAEEALASGAFGQALELARAGLGLEPEPEQRRQLLLIGCKAARASGDGHALSGLSKRALDEATGPQQWATVAEVLVDFHTGRGQTNEALVWARKALAGLGVDVPASTTTAGAMARMMRAWFHVRRLGPRLAELPSSEDPAQNQILALLLLSTTPAYLTDHDLWVWITAELVITGCRAGASAATGWGLLNLGIILGPVLRKDEQGVFIGEAGRRMLAATTFGMRSRERAGWYATMHPATQPLAETLAPLREGVRLGVEEGDPLHAGINAQFYVGHLLFDGAGLDQVAAAATRLSEECKRLGVHLASNLLSAYLAFAQAMTGERPLDAWLETEPRTLGLPADSHQALVEHTLATLALVALGRDDEAVARARLAEPVEQAGGGLVILRMLVFLDAVATGRLAMSGRTEHRRRFNQRRASFRLQHERNADHDVRMALLDGLHAAINGDDALALRHFESACEGARERALPHEVALALGCRRMWWECAGCPVAARADGEAAADALWTWGSRVHGPRALRRIVDAPISAHALADARTQLIVAATRSDVAEAMLVVLVQITGAQHGALALMDGDTHELQATVGPSDLPPPTAALHIVLRTEEPLVLANASRSGPLRLDRGTVIRGARSVLCVPVRLPEGGSMALYLEHTELIGLFRDGAVALAQMLTTVAAVLLENERLQQELANRADRLQSVNVQLQEHTETLEETVEQRTAEMLHIQKMDALGKFVAGVAHEFNNLLTPIGGISELLRTTDRSRQEELLLLVDGAVERASGLISRLLTFSRNDQLQLQRVDVAAVADEVVRFVLPSLDRRVELAWEQPDPHYAMLDPGQLHQVLLNLLVNARDALEGRPDARIEVEVERDGGEVVLSVRDNGPGVPAEIRDRVFDPFFTTKEVGKGSGLGLSVMLGIVESNGGRVTLECPRGRGTEVRCAFPVSDLGESPSSPARSTTTRPVGGRQRVLLVDDEDGIREVQRAMLERSGMEVLDACCGADALALVEFESLDVVLLDVSMPGMTGWQVLAELRRIKPELPVVMCSGYSTAGKSTHEQPDAFLPKPFRLAELLEVVKGVTGGG
ncbi:MAG: response regulator [Proteobacteria bacterium]|nr:response regulator [Pseudomonadota bacterium]